MTAKDLKTALLQEAVQGKLVPQIASEGNARDLLEEIRKEKLSHGLDLRLEASLAINAKSGKRKSKKETALAGSNPCDIKEEEIPFDIPENWCWCRITDIATCELGKTKDALKNKGEMKNYLCSINIQEEGIDLSKVKQMKFEESEYERYTVKKNDLLICEGGDAGRCAIYDRDEPMYYQNALHRVRFFCDLNPKFYLYVFQVYKANKILTEASKGVTIQHLTGAALKELWFPLPPLAEQKRIVAAIEKFMPLIEEYGKKETQLKSINEKIGKLTKKAILQEAVQGKLVPQIASEGNARDLLEEIRKEKLSHGFANSYGICGEKGKKSKSSDLRSKSQIRVTTEITEEEIPFDIPESWCWGRLGEIGDWKAGSTPSRSNPELYNGNIPWLKTGDLTDGDINEIPECISKKALESCSMRLNPIGSVLIAMYGATIGKLGILKIEATTNQACCACVPYNGIYNKYLFYYLMSQKKDFTEKAEGGAQPNISREKLVVHLLPLPPYEEQKRIVAAIEKMLPLCEKLGE